MKLYRILALTVVASFVVMATSCVTSTTTVTAPDGTVTVTKTSGPDAASVNAAANLGGVVGGLVIQHRKIIAEK